MIIELVCINCPKGCLLTVEAKGKDEVSVAGNGCQRGFDFAVSEVSDPKRYLTTTVALSSSMSRVNKLSRLAVISARPIERDKLIEISLGLRDFVLDHSVKVGEKVTEIDGWQFLASQSLE